MAPDNTLQDCDGIAEGSAIDSEIIQDYKKGNQMHLQMNPSKISKKVCWWFFVLLPIALLILGKF